MQRAAALVHLSVLLQDENPGLKQSQLKELAWKNWKKSPENPENQAK